MGRPAELIFLSQEDVIATGIDMERTIDIAERVLVMHEKEKVILPSKVSLQLGGVKEKGQRINAMPTYVGGEFDICGIKWIASTPSNPKKYGIPRAHALVVLNDSETGEPVAIMDATYISAMRTGAMTGVGIKYLAKPSCKIVGMIGSGVQARTQIAAIKEAAPTVQTVKVYSLHEESRESLAGWITEEMGISAEAVESAQKAVEGSDIIVTATTATEPFIKDAWLKEGSFLVRTSQPNLLDSAMRILPLIRA